MRVATATATALAASLLMSVATSASASGLELVGVDMTDHYMVTLKVGSLIDLKKRLGEVGFDEDNEGTSFEKELTEAGLTFTYSGSWMDSPLIPSHTTGPGGIGSLSETSAEGKRFSLDFSYTAPAKLGDDSELVSFAIKSPPSGWGKIELISIKLNPFTIDTGSMLAEHEPLASFTTPVPEPSTYLMMGIGLAALGWARRTRRS
jgi:PEP-CTERM motif